MSHSSIKTIHCPGCKKPAEVTMWESINAGLDPELKAQVLDGSLFAFTCPSCGIKESLAYPSLYHDPEQRFMAWWMPSNDEKQQQAYLEDLNKAELGLPDYRLRLVPNLNCLKEKILIFDNGLDDRVIELIKMAAWTQLKEENIPIDKIYFDGADTEKEHPEILLLAFTEKGESRMIKLGGKEWYAHTAEVLHQKLNVPGQEKTKWRIIDHTYWELVEKGGG